MCICRRTDITISSLRFYAKWKVGGFWRFLVQSFYSVELCAVRYWLIPRQNCSLRMAVSRKRSCWFVYALAEPVWMESVSVAWKVRDSLTTRFLRKIRFVRKAQRRFPAKPPASRILYPANPPKYLRERNGIYPYRSGSYFYREIILIVLQT